MATKYPADAPVFPTQKPAVIVPHPSELKPLYTERLVIRPLRIDNDEDAAGMFELRKRQDVVEWMWPFIADADISATKAWMRGKIFATPDGAGSVATRHFSFSILRRDDPDERILGAVALNSLDPAPSVGYFLHPDAWGKGYATEAVRALVDAWWGLPRAWDFGDEKVFGGVVCANVGSLRVLEKVGFEVYRYVEYGGKLAFMSMGRRGHSPEESS
ncbi:GNAT domain-containing protein [Aspergillus pseudoustus]|uniref:GNAT domain-containing protein n=1 Tax=Aspergillus pseudoustus TaxID=1810923 RepID=A0ABR4KYF4_9EURO